MQSTKGGETRTARAAVWLNACVQATGVQIKARDARVGGDDVGHSAINIVSSYAVIIATKAHTPSSSCNAFPIYIHENGLEGPKVAKVILVRRFVVGPRF